MICNGWRPLFVVGCLALLLCASCGSGRSKKPGTERSGTTVVFPMVDVPTVLTGTQARAAFRAGHWWDRYDFRDSVLVADDVTAQGFAAWLDVLNGQVSDGQRNALLASLLDAASIEPAAYIRFVELAESCLYNPNSPLRDEDAYLAVLRHAVASPGMDSLVKMRYRRLLRLVSRNRPGAPAADFSYITATGGYGTLYGTQGEYLLIFFSNPECEACRDMRERIEANDTLRQAIGRGTLRVLAVCPDGATAQWHAHRPEVPSEWINAFVDPDAFRREEPYDLKAIPTLYLLGKDKCVILKDCTDMQALADTLRSRMDGSAYRGVRYPVVTRSF